jgi:hypothetical protein
MSTKKAEHVDKAVAGKGKGDKIRNRAGEFTEVVGFSDGGTWITFTLADGSHRRYQWGSDVEVAR